MAKINGETAGRLHKFNSYSYYHVLAICGDSHTASALSGSLGNTLDLWLHPTSPTSAESLDSGCKSILTNDCIPGDYAQIDEKYHPKSIDGGNYIILINGATDAQYNIESYSYETMIGIRPGAASKTIASMTVVEPLGVSFMDTIVRAQFTLGASPTTSIYVVKTVFVGYNTMDDGSQTVEVISDLPAAIFAMENITGKIDETGGTYELSLFGCGDTLGNQARYSSFPVTVPVIFQNPKPAKTLKETLQLLQQKLQEVSDRNYACALSNSATIMRRSNPNMTEAEIIESVTKNVLMKVNYQINIEEPTLDERKVLGPSYSSDAYKIDIPQNPGTSETGTSDETAPISFRPNELIPDQIKTLILDRCSKIVKEEKDFFAPVITTTTVITPSESGGCAKEMTIQYNIRKVVSTMGVNKEGKSIANQGVDGVTDAELVDSYNAIKGEEVSALDLITFDYIFTGMNTDIIEMELNFSEGMGYLGSAVNTPPWKPSSRSFPEVSHVIPQQLSQQNSTRSTCAQMPVVQPNKKVMVSQDPVSKYNYMYNMNTYSGIYTQDVTIKITGNDAFLWDVEGTDPMSYSVETNNTPRPPGSSFSNANRVPKLAKINIAYPPTADITNLLKEDKYTVPFWHQGLWQIFIITHEFNDGLFTQTLSLMGVQTTDQNAWYNKYNEAKVKSDSYVELSDDPNNPCITSNAPCAGDEQPAPTASSAVDLTQYELKTNESNERIFRSDGKTFALDPKITSLDANSKYYKILKGPDPQNPNNIIEYSNPRWITEEQYNELSKQTTSKAFGRGAFQTTNTYTIEPVEPKEIRGAKYWLSKVPKQKTAEQLKPVPALKTVGNKIPCTQLLQKIQQLGPNTNIITVGGKAVDKNIEGTTSVVNAKPKNTTPLAVPNVISPSNADIVSATGNYSDSILTNYIDTEEINKSCRPEDVIPYRKLNNNTRSEVERAATDMSLSQELFSVILMIGAAESDFAAAAKNPKSSATGLFQFTGGTWAGLAKQNKIPGVPNTGDVGHLRSDPYLSTVAMVNFTLDNASHMKRVLKKAGFDITKFDPAELYLAHHFGAEGGARIVRAYKQNLINIPITDNRVWGGFGQEHIQKVYSQNPQLAKGNVYTVGDFYLYSSKKLNQKIDKGQILARTNASSSTQGQV